MKKYFLAVAIVLAMVSAAEAGPVCRVVSGACGVVQKVRPVRRAVGFVARVQPVRRVVRGVGKVARGGVRVVRGTVSAVGSGSCGCN